MSEIIAEGGRRSRNATGKQTPGSPLVSVITSVYNGAEDLERTLKSVVAQSYPCVEYIVVDGASKDGTVDILKKYDDVIDYWISARDTGIYDAWNKGVQLAQGEWIAFLGVGDAYLPDAINQYMDFSKQHPDCRYISSRVRLMRDGHGVRTIGQPWSWPAFVKYMTVAHVGSLHHRQLYASYGLYDLTYRITGDYELLLRAGKTLQAGYFPEVTAEMMLGGASNKSTKVLDETFRAKVQTGKRHVILARIEDFIARIKFYIRLYLLS
jgi:glycosyltransferase involved in cell wall biosynthesis